MLTVAALVVPVVVVVVPVVAAPAVQAVVVAAVAAVAVPVAAAPVAVLVPVVAAVAVPVAARTAAGLRTSHRFRRVQTCELIATYVNYSKLSAPPGGETDQGVLERGPVAHGRPPERNDARARRGVFP